MPEFGMMGVDWEERVNFDRMRRERLKKAQDAMEESGVDALRPTTRSSMRSPTRLTARPMRNMLFAVEPYAGKIGIGGFRLENQVFVGEKEPDIFTTLSFDERLLRDVHPLDKTTGRKIRYPK